MSEEFDKVIKETYENLLNSQEELDEDFYKLLYDNLWNLWNMYVNDENKD